MFTLPRAALAAALCLCATAGTSGELYCRGYGMLFLEGDQADYVFGFEKGERHILSGYFYVSPEVMMAQGMNFTLKAVPGAQVALSGNAAKIETIETELNGRAEYAKGCEPLTDRLYALKGKVVRLRVAIDAPGNGVRLTP